MILNYIIFIYCSQQKENWVLDQRINKICRYNFIKVVVNVWKLLFNLHLLTIIIFIAIFHCIFQNILHLNPPLLNNYSHNNNKEEYQIYLLLQLLMQRLINKGRDCELRNDILILIIFFILTSYSYLFILNNRNLILIV